MKLERLPPLPPTLDIGAYMLRALRRDDAPGWYAYLADPEVTRLTSYDIRSLEAVAAMLDRSSVAYAERRANRWARGRKDADRLIGTCGFVWWNVEHAVAEIGYD